MLLLLVERTISLFSLALCWANFSQTKPLFSSSLFRKASTNSNIVVREKKNREGKQTPWVISDFYLNTFFKAIINHLKSTWKAEGGGEGVALACFFLIDLNTHTGCLEKRGDTMERARTIKQRHITWVEERVRDEWMSKLNWYSNHWATSGVCFALLFWMFHKSWDN